VVIAVLAAVAVAVVAVVLIAGGDDEDPRPVPRPGATKEATAPPPTATGPTNTEERRRETDRVREAEVSVQETVTELVESNERGDGRTLCPLLGEPPAARLQGLERCARAAGVDLALLPVSDELSIERVRAAGSRGSATLVGGVTVSLRRVGARWQVTGISR
jgi:hypothetical protein